MPEVLVRIDSHIFSRHFQMTGGIQWIEFIPIFALCRSVRHR
jgi:hypothetical protein